MAEVSEGLLPDSSTGQSVIETRRHQMFPTLSEPEVVRMRRFGTPVSYRSGEQLFEAGKVGPGMFVVLSGEVRITRRDGLGHVAFVVDQGPGQFLAEVGQLSGRVAFVDGHAVGDVEAILISPESLRALLVAEADLGERIMRALILRRVALIDAHDTGPVLIGPPQSADLARLANFLTRNGYPHAVLDPDRDADAGALVSRYTPSPADLPLVVCPDGSVLRNPGEVQLASCLGMVAELSPGKVYDVAIVGGGPAGLATAVYAASEGLSVLVMDSRAFGGQAGASARIENYLGFPTGISGQALSGRAYTQAQKFGAEMLIPAEVAGLNCARDGIHGSLEISLRDGRKAPARTVVVASGARYRRPNIPDLQRFEGRGIWYWASAIEAKLCSQQEVVLVGGGNSAGQAAVFLSGFAARVVMMIRGPGLAASMSRYLIDRIGAAPNIELLTETEIVGLEGSHEEGLQAVRWQNRANGAEETRPIRNVFLFVGADPATEWLVDCPVELDGTGFVKTGQARASASAGFGSGRPALPLETTVPGVFAVGDVRSGSVKRVGGAIGEGAAVVAQLHSFLAAQDQAAEAQVHLLPGCRHRRREESEQRAA